MLNLSKEKGKYSPGVNHEGEDRCRNSVRGFWQVEREQKCIIYGRRCENIAQWINTLI